MQKPTVRTTATGRIEPERIPAHVANNLAQAAMAGILRAYHDPAIQEDFRRWKAERAAKAGAGA